MASFNASFSVFEPEFDRYDRCTEKFHPVNILCLTLDILTPHVNMAFQTETGTDRRRCHTVLPGTGFRDDAFLAHPFRQKRLTDDIIDLVGSRMVQIFPFQINLRPPSISDQRKA